MAKMLHLLLDWEYPHWMMMAGAILVALGFIGLAFRKNRTGRSTSRAGHGNPPNRTAKGYAETASASAGEQRKAKGK